MGLVLLLLLLMLVLVLVLLLLLLLVVKRVLCVLKGLALSHAAVYHTGEMHCHGEGKSHGAQQWLRNGLGEVRAGGLKR